MTFDLKRARELVWAVSERKIWTLLERTGYGGDIDKRRERQAITEICDKQFPSAIAEIERLRAALDKSEQILAHKTKTSTHWYEEGLRTGADLIQCKRVVEQQAARIEELEADLAQSEICIRARLDVVDQQADRIKELEGREEDLFTCYNCGKKVDDVEPGPILGEIHFDPGYPGGQYEPPEPAVAYFVCTCCLRAEGKIGPDADAKPHCWQITEERKAAIKELSELLTAIGCPSCHYYIQKNYGEDITVLRAMLTEAE